MLRKLLARGLLFALATAVLASAITLKHRAAQRSFANDEAPRSDADPITGERVDAGQVAIKPTTHCNTLWRKNQERFFGSSEPRADERVLLCRPSKPHEPGGFNAGGNGRKRVALR